MPGFPRIFPFTDLNKTIKVFNMETISEKYQIKHKHNYLQFVRKNNEYGVEPVGSDPDPDPTRTRFGPGPGPGLKISNLSGPVRVRVY